MLIKRLYYFNKSEEKLMKVHLISNMYPSELAPNYGIFVKNTELILRKAGFEVETTVMNKNIGKLNKLIGYLIYYLMILWKGITKRYDVTYVHYASHNALPLLILKGMRKSTVIYTNVHGSDVVPEVPSQEKYQSLVKTLLTKSNLVIAPSNYYKELVKTKYNLSNKIEVFPSGGVNPSIFFDKGNKFNSKQELNIKTDRKYIGYVSRLDVGKGWDILLEAYYYLLKEGKLDNIDLLIVGDGKERIYFEKKVAEYKLHNKIVYFPLLPQSKLNTIYNAIDVFCFPTTRKGESLGLVGLEAMACSVPVIGSAIGGLLDYIEDGQNGLLFETGDPKSLANKLEKYFSLSEDEQKKYSENAKFKAMEYEVDVIKDQLIEIFNNNKYLM